MHNEINMPSEGKEISSNETQREAIRKLGEVEKERVFGSPRQAAQKAKDFWSEEATLADWSIWFFRARIMGKANKVR